jgi:hypothetical protein
MKRHGLVAAALVTLVLLLLWRPTREPARVEAAGEAFSSVSLSAGTTPKPNSGPAASRWRRQLIRLEGWRFSQQDAVSEPGAFQFATKVGNLENQLNPQREYGQTDWNDPRCGAWSRRAWWSGC